MCMLTNLTNYHSHCSYCDGRAPLEEFVQQAIMEGFTAYGISSHAPLPFENPWTLKSEAVGAYLAEAARLKEKYSHSIELYVGMEIDYLDDTNNPVSSYFQTLPLDYRIGGVHLLQAPSGKLLDIDCRPERFQEHLTNHFSGDLKRLITLYFDRLMRMVELGGFDFVAHPDKISYNASQADAEVLHQPWYNDKIREYFEWIARHGLMVEVNTKTYFRNGFLYPNHSNLKLIRELGIPVVVNSDAHDPAMVNSGRYEALQALKASGFGSVRELHDGIWSDVPIGI